jgi:hypothetical protein
MYLISYQVVLTIWKRSELTKSWQTSERNSKVLIQVIIDTNLNGYNKKKYIAKLLYMYVLGFEIDFGHLEAVNLMTSYKYQEKQMVC